MQPKNAHALNNTWKRQDTTQDMIVWFSGVMPNPAHAWTVRVADSKGYLGDYDATLQGNRFVIDTGQFADFPVGHYVLEIWETYSKDGKAETGIYPNPDSFVTFDINKNVVDDDLVKSFDLDEVLGKAAARANKAIVVDGTETLPAGSQASVDYQYDGERVHFTFKIPKGADGANGDDGKDGNDGATPQIGSNGNWVIAGRDTGKPSVGQKGETGPAPTLSIGSVTKVAPGGNPTASVSGSNGNYALNLGIPEGQQGTGFNRSGIASGTDLNSIKQSGYYSPMGAVNLKNIPPVANTSFFNLVVFSDGDTLTQLVMDPNTSIIYMRGCTGGLTDWHPWVKVGGVSDANSLPNLFTSQTTPTFTVGDADSTQHLSAQRFSYVYGKECQPKSFVGIRPLKGDMIMQSCVIRVSDGATLDSRICYSFYNNASGHYTQHIAPTTITPLGNNEYRLSASYQIAEDNFQLKLMDLYYFGLQSAPGDRSESWIEIDSPFASLIKSGGVVTTNLLQAPDINAKTGVALTNGIGHLSVPAGTHASYDSYYYKISDFRPSTRYRLKFTAWGKGKIQSFIYPGAALSETGSRDGQHTWPLFAAPAQYSYEFDSLSTLSGDAQKTIMFRIPASDQAVDFYLDTNSVVLEKVGRGS